jgi:hypothetical protein
MPTTKKTAVAQALAEFSDFNLKMVSGQQMLHRLKDKDVQIATADKEVVFRQDKVTLYRYKATAKRIAEGSRPRRLWTNRSIHDDRPARRPLHAAQPPCAWC